MTVEHHAGGCQCGAVRYEADVDLSGPLACNCSRCGKLGANLVFAPEGSFTLLAGADSLTTYMFNKHKIRHQFCKVCGIQPFAFADSPKGEPMVAINVRCVDGINVHDLDPKPIDGRSF